ncbi:MAG TPA: S53 family peptidase [Solirubrobacteraceae bacterium]|nr:S53 family peptidase [Solirubrobacteraceae bacterium]
MSTRVFRGLLATGAITFALSGVAAAAPLHVAVPHRFAAPPTTDQCETDFGIACYEPAQFQQAYGVNAVFKAGNTGQGKTIVIVESFGSPTIQADLQTFDQANNLQDPPSFKIITPAGAPPPYDPTDADMGNWGFETTLDVEYAHTMAPGANILLVETPVSETEGTTGFPEIVQAENYVINHHLGDVISQSFGATEETFPNPQSIFALRSAFINAALHGVTVLGASGDGGATDYQSNLIDFYPFRVNSWPSSDPLVTSVGGTQLHLDANGNRTAPDNVWNDQALFGSPAAGGGGVSAVFSRPFFQDSVAGVVGHRRGTPDVSLSAAVDGAAVVYIGYTNVPAGIPGPGWYLVGGTSEASPLFSGIVALADHAAHRDLGVLGPALYQLGDRRHGSGITDITAGNNTVTFTNSDNVTYTVHGYTAGPGYDLSSGLGTPSAPSFVAQLAGGDHGH